MLESNSLVLEDPEFVLEQLEKEAAEGEVGKNDKDAMQIVEENDED